MGLIFSLTLRHATARKVRTLLTLLAVALSVALVVGVTSGYKSMEATARSLLLEMFGTEDIRIQPSNDAEGLLDPGLPEQLRNDPALRDDLAAVIGRLTLTETVEAGGSSARADVVGLRSNDEKALRLPVDSSIFEDIPPGSRDARIQFSAPGAAEVYVDLGLKKSLHLELGDELQLSVGDELKPFKVVGTVHKPRIVAMAIKTVYAPLDALQGDEPRISEVLVTLKPDRDVTAVAETLNKTLGPGFEVRVLREDREELDKNLRSTELLSVVGGSVAMIAGTFIVFTTLSMGVAERQRTLAMLRAIGAERRQVGTMVVFEGLLLGFLGAAFGIPMGLVGLEIIGRLFSDVMSQGIVISEIGLVAAAVGMMLAALLASLLPAWRAMRLDPLAAMSPSTDTRTGVPWILVAVGLLLASLDSFFLFSPEGNFLVTGFGLLSAYEREVRFYGHIFLGLPGLMVGFFLLAPGFVWAVERCANLGVNLGHRHVLLPFAGVLCIAGSLLGGWYLLQQISFDSAAILLAVLMGPPILFGMTVGLGMCFAGLFRRDFELLRQQLTGAVWRAAGTASGLMVGLAVLVLMQVQGGSALRSWKLPDGFPDVFVYTLSRTVAFEAEQRKAIASLPQVAKRPDGSPSVLPIYMLSPNLPDVPFALAGLRMPENTTFIGAEPGPMLDMMQLDFLEGTREEAQKLLEKNGYVLITDEFRRLKGLGVGDDIELSTNDGVVSFKIAGVVRSPGIDVIVATFDMRGKFEQQSAACVFGTAHDAEAVFHEDRARILAVNVRDDVDRETLVDQFRQAVGLLRANVADVREIKQSIQSSFGRVLLLATTVAWAAMLVASLGVTNTILASVRSRRWQFGMLRALGVTRGGLLKLVIAESALLGVVAVVLGLTCGSVLVANARQVMQSVIGFSPPMSFPWQTIAIGIAAVMLVSVVAAIIPALQLARSDPLKLLQAGRSAT